MKVRIELDGDIEELRPVLRTLLWDVPVTPAIEHEVSGPPASSPFAAAASVEEPVQVSDLQGEHPASDSAEPAPVEHGAEEEAGVPATDAALHSGVIAPPPAPVVHEAPEAVADPYFAPPPTAATSAPVADEPPPASPAPSANAKRTMTADEESAWRERLAGPSLIDGKKRRLVDGHLEKFCNKCSEWKPANDENFARRSESPDGFADWCKPCFRIINRNNQRRRRGQPESESVATVTPESYESPVTPAPEPVVAAVHVTPDASVETVEALGEVARLAIRAVEEGTLCTCAEKRAVIVPGDWHEASCPLHRHRFSLPSTGNGSGVWVGTCWCGKTKEHRPYGDQGRIKVEASA